MLVKMAPGRRNITGVLFSFSRDIPIPAPRVIEIENKGMYSAQMHTYKFLRALFMTVLTVDLDTMATAIKLLSLHYLQMKTLTVMGLKAQSISKTSVPSSLITI